MTSSELLLRNVVANEPLLECKLVSRLTSPKRATTPWTPDGARKPRTPVQGSPAPPLRRLLRSMATLEPVRVAYCTVCGLPPEFCEYNTEVPHPASTQDAPARPSGGSGAGKAEQGLAALSLEGTGGASAGGSAGAELVRDGLRARLCPFADSLRARVPRPRAAQILRAQTRPRKAPKVAKSQPRSRRVVTPPSGLMCHAACRTLAQHQRYLDARARS